MLELRKYTINEMIDMFGTRRTQGIERKLNRYGVVYNKIGYGNNLVFEIVYIHDPFKIFCITELGFDGRTDFIKVRNFYNHFFNDEEFRAMPDEVKENRMNMMNHEISRQTIARYINKLKNNNLISQSSTEFIYYFAYKKKQTLVEREKYLKAWHEYWDDIQNGYSSLRAINKMRNKYGGVAKKQAAIEFNGIFNNKIDFLCELIQKSIENEIEREFNH